MASIHVPVDGVAALPVRHGYTLADLDRLTTAAILSDRSMAMDYATRRDIAWSAIAEQLCAAETPPGRGELIRAGWIAIYQAVHEEYREHGYADGRWASGHATARGWLRYWHWATTPREPWADRIVEVLAARQVLAALSPSCRDAILALAVHEDYILAARALAITDRAFRLRISRARHQLRGLWHEHETPARAWKDRRVAARGKPPATHCVHGHELTPDNTYTLTTMHKGRPLQRRECRRCRADQARRCPRAEQRGEHDRSHADA